MHKIVLALHATIFQKLFYGQRQPGNWAQSGRASVSDWIHSLLPRNEFEFVQLIGLIFQIICFVQATATGSTAIWVSAIQIGHWALLVTWLLRLEIFLTIGKIVTFVFLIFMANLILIQGYAPPLLSSVLMLVACIINLCCLFGSYARAGFFPWKVSRVMRPKGFPPRKPGRHRILLIEPAGPNDRRPYNNRYLFYPSTATYLAALVPNDWDIMILDHLFDKIDYDLDVDVVGITTMSFRYHDFKDMAEEFRRRGKCVLLGGPEASRDAERYFEISDSVLVGEAEGYLGTMLEDWKQGKLQKKYVNPHVSDLSNMPTPRFDLLPQRRYYNQYLMMVSTSCPYNCSFCSYNRTRQARLRPIPELVKAIQATPAKTFWFEAPELLVYKDYVLELEKALAPLKITFGTHTTMRSASNEAILRSAYRSGLRVLWLGIESFNSESLRFVNKHFNRPENYQETFDLLNKVGVSAYCHIITGLPHDTPADYEKTLQGLIKGKTAALQAYVLAVFSGDAEFEQSIQKAGGRPLDVFQKSDIFMDRCLTTYKPPGFTDIEMAAAYENLLSGYYSWSSMARRLLTRSPRSWLNLTNDFIFLNLVAKLYRTTVNGIPWSLSLTIDELARFKPGTTGKMITSPSPWPRKRIDDQPPSDPPSQPTAAGL